MSDYNHARKVWHIFRMKNLSNFGDLYVQIDTLLLIDVFEKIYGTGIYICIYIWKTYTFDPCDFYFAPGLLWTVALKEIEIKLELLTDC